MVDKDLYCKLLEKEIRELQQQLAEMTADRNQWKGQAAEYYTELEKRKSPSEKYLDAKNQNHTPPNLVHVPKITNPKKRSYNFVNWNKAKIDIKNLLYRMGDLSCGDICKELGLKYKALLIHLHEWADIGEIIKIQPDIHHITWADPKRVRDDANIQGINRHDH